ncbi:hypothetical protein Tco_0345478 [Tanacetum coccineum]
MANLLNGNSQVVTAITSEKHPMGHEIFNGKTESIKFNVDPNDPYEPAGPTDEPKLADNPTDMEPTDRLIGMNQLELVDGPDPGNTFGPDPTDK